MVVNLDRPAQRRDLDHRDTVAKKPHKPHRLRLMSVDPLLISLARGTLAHLAFGLAERRHDHAPVHPDQHLVRRNRALDGRRQRVGIRLIAGLDAEVDHWLKQRFYLGRRNLRDAAFEDQRDAAPRGLLAQVWLLGLHTSNPDLDVAQEAVLDVRPAIQIDQDAVAFELECRHDNPVTRRGRLTLLVDHLLVLVVARRQVAVGL